MDTRPNCLLDTQPTLHQQQLSLNSENNAFISVWYCDNVDSVASIQCYAGDKWHRQTNKQRSHTTLMHIIHTRDAIGPDRLWNPRFTASRFSDLWSQSVSGRLSVDFHCSPPLWRPPRWALLREVGKIWLWREQALPHTPTRWRPNGRRDQRAK